MLQFRVLVLTCVLLYATSAYGGLNHCPLTGEKSCRCKPCFEPCGSVPSSHHESSSTEVTSFVSPAVITHVRTSSSHEDHEDHDDRCCHWKPCRPKCKCGPNEVWALASREDHTCYRRGKALCKPVWRCRCKKGYRRHNGRCISKCRCPRPCSCSREYHPHYHHSVEHHSDEHHSFEHHSAEHHSVEHYYDDVDHHDSGEHHVVVHHDDDYHESSHEASPCGKKSCSCEY